jgi:hypothetical protein
MNGTDVGVESEAPRRRPGSLWVSWKVDDAARVKIRNGRIVHSHLIGRVGCRFGRSALEVSWEEIPPLALNHQF